ncbi:MAG: zinc ribbon domain-containing protein [Myxococcota bacterium]
MTGIAAYGAYVPMNRLPLALIGGRPAKEGGPEKAVADYDEDAITMAVTAAVDCLSGIARDQVDAVYFASTSYEMREKQGAALIAKALDLRRDVNTQDHSGSLRCGTAALESALHAVAAGAQEAALVVASDCRMGAPRGALEAKLGDGAVAFLVTRDPIARFDHAAAVADELQDLWRIDGERFTHSWEDRFVLQEGYQPNLTDAVKGVLAKDGGAPSDFTKVALYGADARSLGGAVRALGFKPEQVQDPLFGKLGNTGASFALLLLAHALEAAQPGDRFLVASYGDGAHALTFTATDGLAKLASRRGVSWHLARRRALKSYDTYLKSRQLDPKEWDSGADLGLSATIRFRERDADISLVAARCTNCGQLHFPKQRVCYKCFSKDSWEPYRLSDKRGKLLAFTFDYFFPAAEPPTIMVMTEVEGCRLQVQMANTRPDAVALELPVEYVFRKIHAAGGKANYFWKASPVEDA